jgi:hypothetical protein
VGTVHADWGAFLQAVRDVDIDQLFLLGIVLGAGGTASWIGGGMAQHQGRWSRLSD